MEWRVYAFTESGGTASYSEVGRYPSRAKAAKTLPKVGNILKDVTNRCYYYKVTKF